MRVAQLGLLRYGKFSDKQIELPRSEHDFHVIVGPNEAGKSTVRTAITELLYGMPNVSGMAFVHQLQELCISATLQGKDWERSFKRGRGRTPIADSSGVSHAEAWMQSVLEGVSKQTFLQMFSLDHTRLVEGGKSILDPNESVGQLLFQAAAGIDSFGRVRDLLEAQAAEQWANRKGSGEYGKAQKLLEDASAELKRVQVRAAAWREASQAAEDAEDAVLSCERELEQLDVLRTKLERFRRLAPVYARLTRHRADLADVGETLAFPSTARSEVEAVASKLPQAEAAVETRLSEVERIEGELASVVVNQAVIDVAGDINELAALRNQCRAYSRDILLRQGEVKQRLDMVREAGQELGWGEDETPIREKLPSQLALNAVTNVLKSQGRVEEAARSASTTKAEKDAEVLSLTEKLGTLVASDVSPALRLALAAAQALKGTPANLKQLQAAIAAEGQGLQRAQAMLKRPQLSLQALREMNVPSQERVTTLRLDRQTRASAEAGASQRLKEAANLTSQLALRVTQFQRGHRVVTRPQVQTARDDRDAIWSSIKSEQLHVKDGASRMDAALRGADELVDLELFSATDAAELQALNEQLEAAQLSEKRATETHESAEQELQTFEEAWIEFIANCGVPGLHLDDALAWLNAREAVLAQEDAIAEKAQEQSSLKDATEAATATLALALKSEHVDIKPELDLEGLCDIAEAHVRAVEKARTQREAAQEQLDDANDAAARAAQEFEKRNGEVDAWQESWKVALDKASLSDFGASAAEAEAAVARAAQVRTWLTEIDNIRRERIDTMQADLDELSRQASKAAETVAPHLAHMEAFELSTALDKLLKEESEKESERAIAQKALHSAQQLHRQAQATLRELEARLKPLLDLGQVASTQELLPLVAAWERRTVLVEEIRSAETELLNAGDGLNLEELETELSTQTIEGASAELARVQGELEMVRGRLTPLVERRLEAQRKLDAINGGADAAKAESKRQESLAGMGEAGEQYLRFAVSSLLMRWAVDRYRDRKQGPMLKHASTVFKTLTRGAFERLDIDFFQKPPALFAQRANKQLVPVSGLSDGTRDQLFLALRIAALELQLEQGAPFPLVADDLFINFDDDRSKAGLQALFELSKKTQVLFLSHHEHLVPAIEQLFGDKANIVKLDGEPALA